MSLNKSLFTALGVLAISSVMAYEQSFESGTPGNEFTGLSGWGGYGTYSNTAARTLAAGVPLTTANHAVHLAVDPVGAVVSIGYGLGVIALEQIVIGFAGKGKDQLRFAVFCHQIAFCLFPVLLDKDFII